MAINGNISVLAVTIKRRIFKCSSGILGKFWKLKVRYTIRISNNQNADIPSRVYVNLVVRLVSLCGQS